MAEAQQDFSGEQFSDIAVKLRDIEEKQSIIKDRILLIGENLVSEKQETEEEFKEIKNKISALEEEIRKLKITLQMLIDNINNLVRKNEFDMLKRQFEMFNPLELARVSDVKDIIAKALKKPEK
jgi:predicted nuclease with TOPRIM domain